MTPEQTLLRAAQLLSEDAECLKECTTVEGKWDMDTDEFAKADYDERMAIAAKLQLMATLQGELT